MGISKDRRRISGAEYRTAVSIYQQASAGVSQNQYLFAAPTKCDIEEVVILSDTATTGSVAAQHYEFNVHNLTDAYDMISANVSTVTTDISADTAYTLTPDQTTIVDQGDVIEFQVTATGTPTDLTTAIITVQCNYRPV